MESGKNHWLLEMGNMSDTCTRIVPSARAYDIKAVRREDRKEFLWEGKTVRETEKICSDLLSHNFNVSVIPIYAFGEGFYGDV